MATELPERVYPKYANLEIFETDKKMGRSTEGWELTDV
jgi:N6-adenosine-specific RNA methylase IME4